MRSGLAELVPELFEFRDIKVGEDFTVHIDHRSLGLARESNHFVHGFGVVGDVEGIVVYSPFSEPIDGFVAPAAVRFNKQAYLHNRLLFG